MKEESPVAIEPSETAKGRFTLNQRGDVSWKAYSDQWKENHGTLLMGFAALVFLVGVAVLLYQQNRFRAPAFPPASAINRVPGDDSEAIALDAMSAPAIDMDNAFRLRVLGASDAGGSIRVAVYQSAEFFNVAEKADWKTSIPLNQSALAECWIPLNEFTGNLAIAVYHDTNENDSLDRGLLGIPSERYGFSNAARGTVGPPSFEQASIAIPEPGATIELEIW